MLLFGRHSRNSVKGKVFLYFHIFFEQNLISSLIYSVAFNPMTIGEHVYIGEDTIVSANSIGSYVYIGKNCVIGRSCVLKDGCYISDNSVLPSGTNVPAFAIYSGSPGKMEGETLETMAESMIDFTKNYYHKYKVT